MPDPACQSTGIEAEVPATLTRPLHVAVVDEELPYPPTSGKRIRTLSLLRRLAGRHRITYLCHRNFDAAETDGAVAYFESLGIEPVIVDRVRPQKSVLNQGPAFYAGLAANLLSPRPYLVDVNDSPTLRRAVTTYAEQHEVDLWQCEWTPYVPALSGLPASARRLVMAHNVESLIWQRYHETEPNALKRWYIKHQWRKFERFERRAFTEATRAVAVSPEDASLVRQRFGVPRIEVVDNGVDTEYFRPGPGPREPGRILFLGSLDWRPNLDAVELLLDRIFPAVRAAEPSARLDIVGRNPHTALVERVQRYDGVALHANVPDVRPFLHQSGVMAVPLRIGGGSRLKILEALATGLPVVSTQVGAEGLSLESGRHLDLVGDVSALADALLRVIRDPDAAQRVAEQGRWQVLDQYDWDALAETLERIWIGCLAPNESPPQVTGLRRTKP